MTPYWAKMKPATGVTRTLARFVVTSKPDDVPATAVHEAKRSLLHWIGCSIGGSRHESVQCALEALDEFSGKREASILGRGERVDPMLAALVNGISADALGFTDTHLKTVIHPGGVIGPAILALAERQKTGGAEFLHAFVLGIEVACRIGLSVYPWHYARGWHITGTAGVFGAAAAAGRLLQLDEQRMVWALGIAATQAAGLREMFGSMCKSLHIGRAAQNGLFAALLANKNYTSSNVSIEAPRGFAHVLGEKPDLAAITANLGQTFEVAQNTYKPFPCGVVVHPIVDGCITLAAAHNIVAGNIARVVLRVNPLVLELTGRKTPVTTAEAKLSVYHSAAAAIVAHRITEREYEEDVIADPDVLSLRTRIDAIADAGIREDEADIVVELQDGRSLHQHVEHAIGSAQRPMSDGDIEAKFLGLTERRLPRERADMLIRVCWNIQNETDAAVIARLAVGDADSQA